MHVGNGCRVLTAGMCVVALLAAVAGCQSSHQDVSRNQAPLVVPAAVLADYEAELAEGISLPDGFYPLVGHYDLDNPADHYEGWPRYIVCEADRMVMAYVPAQEILMGGGTDADEVPARHVIVDHFYMDLMEVSNAQFAVFARRSSEASDRFGMFWVPGRNDHHPARNVTWFEAAAYANWANKTLPLEAQWEAAARGSDRRLYPWGNEEQSDVTLYLCNANTERANYDGYEATAPVMNFSAGISPFGIFNMAGNVWEWCADWYDPGRYAYPSEEDPATGLERGRKEFGDTNYPNPAQKDIPETRVGPIVGSERVIRGGSFTNDIIDCRVDSRAAALPAAHQHNIGFRCVLPLPEQREDDSM
jgi:formylglycine-generating enzyme required for sulfatase activity